MRITARATKPRCARGTSCWPTKRLPTRPGSRRSKQQMAEHGTAIAGARTRTVARARTQAGGRSRRRVRARRDCSSTAGTKPTWRRSSATAVAATQRPAAQRLARTGRILLVTHRAKRMAAARSSTGEQKALLLGLVLAHAELVAERRGEPPILLLDEVAAHLDPEAPRGTVRPPRRARPGVDDGHRSGAVRRCRRRDAASMSKAGTIRPT